MKINSVRESMILSDRSGYLLYGFHAAAYDDANGMGTIRHEKAFPNGEGFEDLQRIATIGNP